MESFSFYLSLSLWATACISLLIAFITGGVVSVALCLLSLVIALGYYWYHSEKYGALLLFYSDAPDSTVHFPGADRSLHPAAQATCYHRDTPPALVAVLETLYRECTPVCIAYGDVETGEVLRYATGYVNRSTDPVRIPVLSPYKNRGGMPISDHRIVRIVDVLHGIVLYDCLGTPQEEPTQSLSGSSAVMPV